MNRSGAVLTAEKVGIACWMDRVLRECDRVAPDFAPDPVHDLRVALRRCRSISAGLMQFDPDRGWRDMRKEATRLFKKLGELRDCQVMAGWACSASGPGDQAAALLLEHLSSREVDLKRAGSEALNRFDRKKWALWSERLPKRAARIPGDSPAFRHLALEIWDDARRLHQQALRNRSHIGFHRLRIGLKKFRYITENFLPSLHQEWGSGLREQQDLLGETHDLHVLFQTAISIGAFPDREIRSRWRLWIDDEIDKRLALYREKMIGSNSLWRTWRAGLPAGSELDLAVLERLRTWASFRDPDCHRSVRVARLALEIYDGMSRLDLVKSQPRKRTRDVLEAAALLHAVGTGGRQGKRHKESCRQIRRLKTPVGWTSEDFLTMALVVRHHTGKPPARRGKGQQSLPEDRRRLVAVLSGILRMAVSLVPGP